MTIPRLQEIRAQFPAFSRKVSGQPAAYFDGPAGSQVPQSVIDAVTHALAHTNANRGAPFETSRESDAMLDEAHRAVADLLGTERPDEVAFGANMTTLTMAFSRALARTWNPGDEIIVTRLDHDANVTPWVLAARDAGAVVHHIDVDLADCTLDLEQYGRLLNDRTRLVAVGYASNATGTINPVRSIAEAAHKVGAEVFVDAVHYAPHGRINVRELGIDYLVCSAYKFFGPHVGMLWGQAARLEELVPYKLRPSPESLPGRWMTGTQNHEGIAGVAAAIDYLASLAPDADESRSTRLDSAFAWITEHEQQLLARLLDGLRNLPEWKVWGISDPERLSERVPTVSLTHPRIRPHHAATLLGDQGLFAWAGNHYALPFTEKAGLEPDGTLRVGLLHYNTHEEVDRLLNALSVLTT